jgi:hypothetical protein
VTKFVLKFSFFMLFLSSGLGSIFIGQLILGMVLIGMAILIPAS